MLEVGICPRRPGPSRAAPAATGSPEGWRSRWAPQLGFVLWIRGSSQGTEWVVVVVVGEGRGADFSNTS